MGGLLWSSVNNEFGWIKKSVCEGEFVCVLSSLCTQPESQFFFLVFILTYLLNGSIVVKPLCYKLEGRGFNTRGDFLNLPNPSGRAGPWGLLSL
jgi:hypothetical protein